MTTRHEFLRSLHELLQPATYLEIGVQFGYSLHLARHAGQAIGIDPNPMHRQTADNTQIFSMTSDEFFAEIPAGKHPHGGPIDFAFIDGMHLAEFALRDFMNVERCARPDGTTVAVLDDVLPYRADIAGRVPLPGDWTGDVWKVDEILAGVRPDLTRILVDVDPTGVLVVLGLDPADEILPRQYDNLERGYAREWDVPEKYVDRSTAVQPGDALHLIKTYREKKSC